MLFTDGYRYNLTHKSVSQEIVLSARNTDNCIKTQRTLDYNSLQNIRQCNFEIGDDVLGTTKNQPSMTVFTFQKNSKLLTYYQKATFFL